MLLAVLFVPYPSNFAGGSSFSRSSFSRSGKRRPWSNFWVIENRVVSYTPLCLKVVIEPLPSDSKGGLRFLGLRSSFSGVFVL